MRRFALYLLDLDGTIYRGNEPIPGALETVRALQSRGDRVRYLTNNSSLTQTEYAGKLRSMGFEANENEIYSSAVGAAAVLRNWGCKTCFAVGMPGLVETLGQAGIVEPEEGAQAEAVAVGICKQFTYRLLDEAMQQLLGGARYLATNPDTTFPLEGGRLAPGAGSLVAAVSACSGKSPFVVGKPNPFMIELALQEAGVDPSDALVVGDRLNTDIESGRRAGCQTHLVLTGVDQEAPEGQSFSRDLAGLL